MPCRLSGFSATAAWASAPCFLAWWELPEDIARFSISRRLSPLSHSRYIIFSGAGMPRPLRKTVHKLVQSMNCSFAADISGRGGVESVRTPRAAVLKEIVCKIFNNITRYQILFNHTQEVRRCHGAGPLFVIKGGIKPQRDNPHDIQRYRALSNNIQLYTREARRRYGVGFLLFFDLNEILDFSFRAWYYLGMVRPWY